MLVIENWHAYWTSGGAERACNRYIAIVYGDEDIICAFGFALLKIMRERDAQSAEYFFDIESEGLGIPLKFNRLLNFQLTPNIGFYRLLLERVAAGF